jgi:hypothetical protein
MVLTWTMLSSISCTTGGIGETEPGGTGGAQGASGPFPTVANTTSNTAQTATAGGGADASATTGGSTSNSTSASSGAPNDPYAEDRNQTLARINELRATKGLPPYQRWIEGEACADLQAQDDSQTMMPHNAWFTGKFGCDGGSNQNECPGWGGPPCVDAMWAEQEAPGCSNCDNCPGDHGCDGCDFYGTLTGDVCGHYENLSATSYSMVACGFGGGWMVINFK